MTRDPARPPLAELAEIDRLIHEPARLAILSLLYVIDSADFIFIMNQTGMTWGNLSAHMTKLEEAGHILVNKTFKGKRPQTTLQLTPQGRDAFREYATTMKAVFQDFGG